MFVYEIVFEPTLTVYVPVDFPVDSVVFVIELYLIELEKYPIQITVPPEIVIDPSASNGVAISLFGPRVITTPPEIETEPFESIPSVSPLGLTVTSNLPPEILI